MLRHIDRIAGTIREEKDIEVKVGFPDNWLILANTSYVNLFA